MLINHIKKFRPITYLLTSIIIASSFIINMSGCKDKVTDPPEEPSGYQEDIPWPSLADSPWPMNHHDPQNSGRSRFIGPESGIIQWEADQYSSNSGVSITLDSIILYTQYSKLTAINLNKDLKWEYTTSAPIMTTPIVTSYGIIYFANVEKTFAINYSGEFLWEKNLKVSSELLNIDKHGNLYLISSDKILYALNKDGNILWLLSNQDFSYYSRGISFSPDGKTLYIPGITKQLYAVDVDAHNIKWEYGNNEQLSAPVISSDGTIYLQTKKSEHNFSLTALDPGGNKKWEYPFQSNSYLLGCVPAIDRSGNIYFAIDTLFALDYKGNFKWKRSLGKIADCPIICDQADNIYIGLMSDAQSIEIISIDKNGNNRWSIQVNESQVGGAPAIGFGKLFFPSWSSRKIYSIY